MHHSLLRFARRYAAARAARGVQLRCRGVAGAPRTLVWWRTGWSWLPATKTQLDMLCWSGGTPAHAFSCVLRGRLTLAQPCYSSKVILSVCDMMSRAKHITCPCRLCWRVSSLRPPPCVCVYRPRPPAGWRVLPFLRPPKRQKSKVGFSGVGKKVSKKVRWNFRGWAKEVSLRASFAVSGLA